MFSVILGCSKHRVPKREKGCLQCVEKSMCPALPPLPPCALLTRDVEYLNLDMEIGSVMKEPVTSKNTDMASMFKVK